LAAALTTWRGWQRKALRRFANSGLVGKVHDVSSVVA
jgi:hypothetical protein